MIRFTLLTTLLLGTGTFSKGPSAAEPPLIAHWMLSKDVKDAGPNALKSSAKSLAFERATSSDSRPSARFNGKSSHVRVEHDGKIHLGKENFSLSLWVHTPESLDDDHGDLITLYDPEKRIGFNLSLRTNTGITTNQSNTRQLQFGIDSGTNPTWRDEGRPGNAIFPMSMSVHDGALYAGTASNANGEVGRVFRYSSKADNRWIDCGAPDGSNAVSSLAVFQGQLYAGTAKYRFAGSSLPESPNATLGGGIFRYKGEKNWEKIGQLPDTEAIGGLVVFKNQLYATSLYRPAGFYRLSNDKWVALALPDGKRVESLCVYNGYLWAGSYDGGFVFRFDGDKWRDYGRVGENTQTYSFVAYQGQLCVATWPSGRVYQLGAQNQWIDLGRLGEELEVMGMLVHNGKLYAGTLPLAEVYRYDSQQNWTRTAQLDATPNVRFRRAWTMAQHQGRLFCSTLPSGKIHSLQTGACVTHDRELTPGWHHVAAIREGGQLKLFVDGKAVATSEPFDSSAFDLTTNAPLLLGAGSGDFFNGHLRDVRIFQGALSAAKIAELARP